MWLVVAYEPTTLYSLKPSTATSSGGQTLLAPTPFALKMALLDIAIRTLGLADARPLWPTIRDLEVALRLPEQAVVTKLFARILKPNRSARGFLGRTIAYREYVYYGGAWQLALAPAQGDIPAWLKEAASRLSYLGKRGGFLQLCEPPRIEEQLPPGSVRLNPASGQAHFDSRGTLQVLDDCGPKMTFEHADIYGGKTIKLHKERIPNHIVLPYRPLRSAKSYTLYQRLEQDR